MKPAGKIALLGLLSVGAACCVTRGVSKRLSKKEREYLEEPEIKCYEGKLYRRMPNGVLVPYFNEE